MFDKVFVVLPAADDAFAAALLRAVCAYARALYKSVVGNGDYAAFVCDDVFHAEFAFRGHKLGLARRRIFFLHLQKLFLYYGKKFFLVFKN